MLHIYYIQFIIFISMKNNRSLDKKILATPVVLIDESEPLAITRVINNKENSSSLPNKHLPFSSGFKYRPIHNPNHLSDTQGPAIIDKATVYDEFGIINESIGKKKYR